MRPKVVVRQGVKGLGREKARIKKNCERKNRLVHVYNDKEKHSKRKEALSIWNAYYLFR